ncbi:MAG: hypothetical protein ABEI74_03170 [Candidatus Pacearchaeota archaeon]
MLESGVFLQYYGSFGGAGGLISQLEAWGVFDFMIPFLLVFAIVFTVLQNIPLFQKNKGVNSVIGISVALMSLQFGFVSEFFAQIFPTFGAILGVLLLVVVLFGFVGDKGHAIQRWAMFIFALVAVGIIVSKAYSVSTFFGGGAGGLGNVWYYLSANFGNILLIGGFIGAIIAVINISPKTNAEAPKGAPFYLRQADGSD